MVYATEYLNVVEVGSKRRRAITWDKPTRSKFTEKKLTEELNRAYNAGWNDAIEAMRGKLEEME